MAVADIHVENGVIVAVVGGDSRTVAERHARPLELLDTESVHAVLALAQTEMTNR